MVAVGLDSAESAALLDGLASAQAEASGWRAVVRPLLAYADLRRVDDATVILTVPQAAGYDVAAPETLTLAVPPGVTFAAATGLAATWGPARRLWRISPRRALQDEAT